MEPVAGARTFQTTGAAYDAFMGRYSKALAPLFVDQLAITTGQRALDIGCGPGSLTSELVHRLGTAAVAACDPSPSFVAECASRNPGVEVRPGSAEAIPFPDDSFDLAAAQLVFHFVTDPAAAASELRRVVRPGGTIGVCVWDFDAGMQMLRAFWDAAAELDPEAPDEARTLRFGRPGEVTALFTGAGLTNINETTLNAQSTYQNFDELWAGFRAGIGPAGAYCPALANDHQHELRAGLQERLGTPPGAFTLSLDPRASSSSGAMTAKELS